MYRHLIWFLIAVSLCVTYASCQKKETESQQSGSASTQTSQSKYSPQIQALLNEAQSGAPVPIHIEMRILAPGEPEPLQGNTRHMPDGIFISVVSGISKDYEEALLAHELFHVILSNKKFDAGFGLKESYQIPYMTLEDSIQSLHAIGTYLSSCFPDELIDRETAKRGFKPELLTERQAALILNQLNDGSIPQDAAIKKASIMQNGAGLVLFCLARRHGNLPMDEIDKGEALVSPGIVKAEKELLKNFGKAQCEIDDPKGCYALALKLRDAIGLNGILYLTNPYSLGAE